MSTENQAEIFIRLLADALEENRLIQRATLTLQHKERTEHFMKVCSSARNNAMRPLEPLDRVQVMAATQDQHFG